MITEADLREEKPAPVPEWEAKAEAAHQRMVAEVGPVDPAETLNMLRHWISDAEPANEHGQVSFSRAMLESARDALEALLAPQDHAPSAGAVQVTTDPADVAERLKDAERFQYLLDHHAYHYAMTVVEPSPAEWGIEWQYQQTKPGEERLSFRDLIDRDIQWRAEQDAASPPPPEGER